MAKEKAVLISAYMEPALAEKLKARAEKERRSLSAQVLKYVEEGMAIEDSELAARMMRA